LRAYIWQKMIGNSLGITQELYKDICSRLDPFDPAMTVAENDTYIYPSSESNNTEVTHGDIDVQHNDDLTKGNLEDFTLEAIVQHSEKLLHTESV